MSETTVLVGGTPEVVLDIAGDLVVDETVVVIEAGPRGDPGLDGLDGAVGADGIPGTPGTDGAPGVDGAAGTDGLPGTDGVSGEVGANGADGAVGPAGASAYQAWLAAGNAGTVEAYLTSLVGLPGMDGQDGAPGQVGTPGTDGSPGIDGTPGIPGADGAPGDPGADGTPGATGAPGASGADGAAGADGPPGTDGAPGTPGAAGTSGEAGAAGVDGADGAPGSAGASAYQVWLAAGNTGTVEVYLASLVGSPGVGGQDGVPGQDGAPGSDGLPGVDGAPGTPGVDGAPGVGVPAGGTAGQVLVKDSATDFDTSWATSIGGGLPEGGVDGQLLGVVASAPAWMDAPAGGSNLADAYKGDWLSTDAYSRGDVVVADAATWLALADDPAGAVPSVVGSYASGAESGPLTLINPSGTDPDDVQIVVLWIRDETGDPGGLSGWTLGGTIVHPLGLGRAQVYYRTVVTPENVVLTTVDGRKAAVLMTLRALEWTDATLVTGMTSPAKTSALLVEAWIRYGGSLAEFPAVSGLTDQVSFYDAGGGNPRAVRAGVTTGSTAGHTETPSGDATNAVAMTLRFALSTPFAPGSTWVKIGAL